MLTKRIRKMKIFLWFGIASLLMLKICSWVEQKCSGSTSPPCCVDYRWSRKRQMCIECLPGFYGINCSESCRFPNYGDGCQQKCYCAEQNCHPAVGCHEFEIHRKRMLSLNTSNILLGCLVFLVAVLVLLKLSRLSPHCRKCFQQQQNVNNQYAHRYDSDYRYQPSHMQDEA